VESIAEEGAARVVYAVGDPFRKWSRYTAAIAERDLKIADVPFSATYEMTREGALKGKWALRDARSEITMAKADFAALTKPGAAVDWSGGKSEFLQTDLVEDGKPIRLEVVIFKPDGKGPFPLAVINHGSTGNNPALVKQTCFDVGLVDFLNERGWMVAFPQRRGRGKSEGQYKEEFSADQTSGYTDDPDIFLAGAERALQDLESAITALRRRPDVAASPILIGGVSRGGVLSVAYAGAHPGQIFGVINFVGGWIGEGVVTATAVNQNLFKRGGHFGPPTLWLYGRGDRIYSTSHSRENFAAFQRAGGQGTFLEFDVPGGDGHFLTPCKDLWSGPVGDYLDSLGAPGQN
ncbi:MAG: hypothetical protein J2P49_08290, partial [Methylocapsa sp.]|nr:hypothetical protein [Methylocapsa sp.]